MAVTTRLKRRPKLLSALRPHPVAVSICGGARQLVDSTLAPKRMTPEAPVSAEMKASASSAVTSVRIDTGIHRCGTGMIVGHRIIDRSFCRRDDPPQIREGKVRTTFELASVIRCQCSFNFDHGNMFPSPIGECEG
ncbi:uncharacterized protein LOC123409184 [Hordeum vulgare subsp. vulgare]|uniref:uncharacterized protein LOC123409184 n=1 Tax=Hordeum vulgare subsp. vulgare TaxID=112509 RepID=UPI00162DA78F|nr:uncharacterized protein LOC123409184 [Hordeum vulgare subsp. vulgare]